jgi:hypothetical protein
MSQMPMSNNDNINNTTQPALNLVDLNNDVLTVILEFLNMKDACRLYRTGNKILREAIAETEFDFYSTYERIPRGVSVKQFRKVFVNAIGIGIYEPMCYIISNEDFYYMVPSRCKNNPKGLQKVKIRMASSFEGNEQWTQKKYKKNAFNNLKGIHSLNISGNQSVTYRHLKILTDIKCLIMDECLHIHESILQYFTKVKLLSIYNCRQITSKALKFLKSNDLETLEIYNSGIDPLKFEKFLKNYPIKIANIGNFYKHKDKYWIYYVTPDSEDDIE